MNILHVVSQNGYIEGSGIYHIVNPLINELGNRHIHAELLIEHGKDLIFQDTEINIWDKALVDRLKYYDIVVFHGLYQPEFFFTYHPAKAGSCKVLGEAAFFTDA